MTKASLKVASNNEIKIDKGIAQPSGGGRIAKYPFRQMEVGDSFMFPVGYAGAHYYGMARDFTSQCFATGENKKFKTSKVEGGYRCWRIE